MAFIPYCINVILRLFHMAFIQYGIYSILTFIQYWQLFHMAFIPYGIYSILAFIPYGIYSMLAFIPYGIYSILAFIPYGIYSILAFIPYYFWQLKYDHNVIYAFVYEFRIINRVHIAQNVCTCEGNDHRTFTHTCPLLSTKMRGPSLILKKH